MASIEWPPTMMESTMRSHLALELLEENPRQSCDIGNGEVLTFSEFHKGAPHKLVFLPGYGIDADLWGALHAIHDSFEDHHIIAVNPRGYGGSTKNRSAHTHEENADDVKLLLNKIGIKRAMCLGYSTGGGTALSLAIRYPDTIFAAFLKNSIPLDGTRWASWFGKEFVKKEEFTEVVDNFGKMGLFGPTAKEFHACFSSFVQPVEALPPVDSPLLQRTFQGVTDFSSKIEGFTANTWFNVTLIHTPSSPPSMLLKNLRSKVIVIHGARDINVPVMHVRSVTNLAIAENWAPAGMISYYEHSGGHFPLWECPDEYTELYRKALEEQVLKKEDKVSGR